MDHVAIMKKYWKLIPKIITGEKTIESRWYQTRRTPWNRIHAGDRIFFKNSGEPISAQALVARVLQFEIACISDIEKILIQYGKKICLVHADPRSWKTHPRYCVLLFLQDSKKIKTPFQVDKKGFGLATAWITVPHIRMIRR